MRSLHHHVVDSQTALDVAAPVLALWAPYVAHAEGAAALSGGVLDSWPAWVVDGFRICQHEAVFVQAYARHAAEVSDG